MRTRFLMHLIGLFLVGPQTFAQTFAQGEPAALDESNPMVAAMVVIGTAYTIERIEAYCQRLHPDTAAAVTTAKEAWMARNGSVYERAGGIISAELSQDERNLLFAEMQSEQDRIENMLDAATSEESLAWCTTAPERFEQPEMNMRGRRALLTAIKNYRG